MLENLQQKKKKGLKYHGFNIWIMFTTKWSEYVALSATKSVFVLKHIQ